MNHDFLMEAAIAEENMTISAGNPRSRRTREVAERLRAIQDALPPAIYDQFTQVCVARGVAENTILESLVRGWIAAPTEQPAAA